MEPYEGGSEFGFEASIRLRWRARRMLREAASWHDIEWREQRRGWAGSRFDATGSSMGILYVMERLAEMEPV